MKKKKKTTTKNSKVYLFGREIENATFCFFFEHPYSKIRCLRFLSVIKEKTKPNKTKKKSVWLIKRGIKCGSTSTFKIKLPLCT